MFSQSNGYSLSDIAAITGNNNNRNGAFGEDGWWIILLFLFGFGNGWGNGGWGGNGSNGAATREDIALGFDVSALDNGIRDARLGISDGFYNMNTGMLNGFSGVQNALCSGFADINSNITQNTIAGMQNTFGLSNGITNANNNITSQLTGISTNIATNACDIERLVDKEFCTLDYNLASQECETRRAVTDGVRDIIDNNNAGIRSVLEFLTQDKIASLTAENQSLKFAASQAAQNAYLTASQQAQTDQIIDKLATPTPVPAYTVPNPYNSYYNSCSGCGCSGYMS